MFTSMPYSGRAAVDIPSVKKKLKMAVFMLVKVVTHNTFNNSANEIIFSFYKARFRL